MGRKWSPGLEFETAFLSSDKEQIFLVPGTEC